MNTYLPSIKTWSLCLCLSIFYSGSALAEHSAVLQSDDFKDVLITAGYSTAFGAATGAALLPFVAGSSAENLRFVAGGASIGFLVGSVLGFYNVSQSKSYKVPYYHEIEPEKIDTEINSNVQQESLLDNSISSSCSQSTPSLLNACNGHYRANFPLIAMSSKGIILSLVHLSF